jgi:hypothetical protein
MKCAILFAMLLAAGLLSPAPAQDTRRDGNWWRNQTRLEQTTYVIGFFDGMELGHSFSYWGLPLKDGKRDPVSVTILNSYSTMIEKYLKDVTSTQVSDGLTKLYEDYRNRTILIQDAVWLVANAIAGESDKEMQIMIENFRKSAR